MGGRRCSGTRSRAPCGAGQRDRPPAAASRSAQSSIEYLLVVGFGFLLIATIMVVTYSQSSGFSRQVSTTQIQRVGSTIIDAANTAYYAGPPTKKTIRLYFPQHITAVSISGNTLVFSMQGEGGAYDYVLDAQTNLTGSIKSGAGVHTITVRAQANAVNITDR